MSTLQVRNLCLDYSKKNSKKHFAIENLNFEVEDGEIVALVGASGCGKSTILKLIAGFLDADSGQIYLGNRNLVSDINFVAAEKRKISLVFQDYALFPNMNVFENIKFAISKESDENIKTIVANLLITVGLEGYENRKAHELSGGQKQRVALARALASQPDLILLDEPFSSIDETLKDSLRIELRKILKQTATTAIIVSHDTKDAYFTADRIIYIENGKITQQGRANELYNFPQSKSSAEFMGEINILSDQEINDIFEINQNSKQIHISNYIRLEEIKLISEENRLLYIQELVSQEQISTSQVISKNMAKVEDCLYYGWYYIVILNIDGVRIKTRSHTALNYNDKYYLQISKNK
jgi:iron(III) transport system ATP-binding protein